MSYHLALAILQWVLFRESSSFWGIHFVERSRMFHVSGPFSARKEEAMQYLNSRMPMPIGKCSKIGIFMALEWTPQASVWCNTWDVPVSSHFAVGRYPQLHDPLLILTCNVSYGWINHNGGMNLVGTTLKWMLESTLIKVENSSQR